jgi:hypothetical protein
MRSWRSYASTASRLPRSRKGRRKAAPRSAALADARDSLGNPKQRQWDAVVISNEGRCEHDDGNTDRCGEAVDQELHVIPSRRVIEAKVSFCQPDDTSRARASSMAAASTTPLWSSGRTSRSAQRLSTASASGMALDQVEQTAGQVPFGVGDRPSGRRVEFFAFHIRGSSRCGTKRRLTSPRSQLGQPIPERARRAIQSDRAGH